MVASTQVLVVEDDGDALEAILDVLEVEGFVVVGARDGEEALVRLATMAPPWVILCDVMMPGMNGVELGAAIRSDQRLASVAIEYFSAARRAERLVGAQVLKKPFTPDALIALVRRHVPLSSPR